MSYKPPNDPSNPSPGYVPYYRGPAYYGSVDKLWALYQGYNRLTIVFLINIVLAIAINVATGGLASMSPDSPAGAWSAYVVGIGVMFLAITFLSLPANRMIGFGKDWGPTGPLVASVLMGLNSALCCGIIGYVVVQQIAYSEMKRYGISPTFLGIRRQQVELRIREMQAMAQSGPQPETPAPGYQPPFET